MSPADFFFHTFALFDAAQRLDRQAGVRELKVSWRIMVPFSCQNADFRFRWNLSTFTWQQRSYSSACYMHFLYLPDGYAMPCHV